MDCTGIENIEEERKQVFKGEMNCFSFNWLIVSVQRKGIQDPAHIIFGHGQDKIRSEFYHSIGEPW